MDSKSVYVNHSQTSLERRKKFKRCHTNNLKEQYAHSRGYPLCAYFRLSIDLPSVLTSNACPAHISTPQASTKRNLVG